MTSKFFTRIGANVAGSAVLGGAIATATTALTQNGGGFWLWSASLAGTAGVLAGGAGALAANLIVSPIVRKSPPGLLWGKAFTGAGLSGATLVIISSVFHGIAFNWATIAAVSVATFIGIVATDKSSSQPA